MTEYNVKFIRYGEIPEILELYFFKLFISKAKIFPKFPSKERFLAEMEGRGCVLSLDEYYFHFRHNGIAVLENYDIDDEYVDFVFTSIMDED